MTANKLEAMTRHFAERWSKVTADKELEQYLSDGIAQLEDEHRKQVEALQADYERLRKHLQSLIDQTTPLVPEPGNPMWSRRIQLDEVIAERDSLRAECEKLRKDAERYRWLCEFREWPDEVDAVIDCGNKVLIDAAIDAYQKGEPDNEN